MLEPIKRQKDWDRYLPHVEFAYRSCEQESTGESPNSMMLGREVYLPIDLMIERPPPDEPECETYYADELRERIKEIHACAREALKLSTARQNQHYDHHAVGGVFKVGQFVWLFQNKRTPGVSKKLSLQWEGPYLVTKVLVDVIYRIQRTPRCKAQVVHSDRLKIYQGEPLTPWITSDAQEGEQIPEPACQDAQVPGLASQDALVPGPSPQGDWNPASMPEVDPVLEPASQVDQTIESDTREDQALVEESAMTRTQSLDPNSNSINKDGQKEPNNGTPDELRELGSALLESQKPLVADVPNNSAQHTEEISTKR